VAPVEKARRRSVRLGDFSLKGDSGPAGHVRLVWSTQFFGASGSKKKYGFAFEIIHNGASMVASAYLGVIARGDTGYDGEHFC
jgi:hypothetical protein